MLRQPVCAGAGNRATEQLAEKRADAAIANDRQADAGTLHLHHLGSVAPDRHFYWQKHSPCQLICPRGDLALALRLLMLSGRRV